MEIKIEWFEKGGKQYGRFCFTQKLTKKAAEAAIKEWKNIFDQRPADKFILIWDCTELIDYEPMARIFWQKALKETQQQITKVWLASDSKMIRAGASIMNLFVKFDLKVMTSESDIFEMTEPIQQVEMTLS